MSIRLRPTATGFLRSADLGRREHQCWELNPPELPKPFTKSTFIVVGFVIRALANRCRSSRRAAYIRQTSNYTSKCFLGVHGQGTSVLPLTPLTRCLPHAGQFSYSTARSRVRTASPASQTTSCRRSSSRVSSRPTWPFYLGLLLVLYESQASIF